MHAFSSLVNAGKSTLILINVSVLRSWGVAFERDGYNKASPELMRLMERGAEARGISLSMLLREIIKEYHSVRSGKPGALYSWGAEKTNHDIKDVRSAIDSIHAQSR